MVFFRGLMKALVTNGVAMESCHLRLSKKFNSGKPHQCFVDVDDSRGSGICLWVLDGKTGKGGNISGKMAKFCTMDVKSF
jgi:hypothetical protein